MIKKLVKYGNSHAIVLDKALLEILNISDTTQLKLSTDGTALTITPMAQEAPKTTVSVSEYETAQHFGNILGEKYKSDLEQVSPEMMCEARLHFNALEKKYNYFARMQEISNSPIFKESLAELDQKSRTENFTADVYMRELAKLQQSILPDFPIAKFQEECAIFSKELADKYQK